MGRVQINYKSGQSVEVECEAFSINRLESGLSFAWKGVHPRPLLLGVENIEAVWALDAMQDRRHMSDIETRIATALQGRSIDPMTNNEGFTVSDSDARELASILVAELGLHEEMDPDFAGGALIRYATEWQRLT